MNDNQFNAARTALADARRAARRIEEPLPAGWVPANLDEAVHLQRAVAADLAGLGGPGGLDGIRGWKISGLTAEQQRAMGVACPLCAPLLEAWVRESGAAFALASFIDPRLECEFAFELNADLPARVEPYARAEVEAAIGAMRIAVEIVDTRLPAGSGAWMELADDLNNGGFVFGGASKNPWRTLRYAEQTIVLRARAGNPTTELARGNGSAVLGGDPVGAVVLLANLPATHPRGLRAGDIVTTGSCTGAVAVPGPGDYEADFGPLGTVRLQLFG